MISKLAKNLIKTNRAFCGIFSFYIGTLKLNEVAKARE